MFAKLGVAKFNIGYASDARLQDVSQESIETRNLPQSHRYCFRNSITYKLSLYTAPLLVVQIVNVVSRIHADITGLNVVIFDIAAPRDCQDLPMLPSVFSWPSSMSLSIDSTDSVKSISSGGTLTSAWPETVINGRSGSFCAKAGVAKRTRATIKTKGYLMQHDLICKVLVKIVVAYGSDSSEDR